MSFQKDVFILKIETESLCDRRVLARPGNRTIVSRSMCVWGIDYRVKNKMAEGVFVCVILVCVYIYIQLSSL